MNILILIDNNKYLLLVIISIIAIVLDLLFYTGFYGSDDKSYILFAHELANGNIPIQSGDLGEFISSSGQSIDFGALRFAYTLPLSLIYYITGGNLFALNFLNILLHIGIILVTFRIGEVIEDARVGIFGSFIVGISPVFYVFSGMVLPDNSEVFWLFLSLLYILSIQKNINSAGKTSFRKILIRCFISGLFLGLSYSSKLSALIMLVPIGIYILTIPQKLFSKQTLQLVLSFGTGFVLIIVVETIIIYFIFDELLSRYEIIAGMKDHYLRRATHQGITVAERYRRMWKIFSVHFDVYILYMTLFIILWFPFVVRKNYLLWFILIWGVLYKTFGTTNFSTYAPPVVQVRYFAFSVPIIGIIMGLMIVKLYETAAHFTRYKSELKIFVLIALIGTFSAFTYLNVKKNLPLSGRLYRTPLVQSTDNAIEFLRAGHPGQPVFLSDTCKYWFYPYYFLDNNPSSIKWPGYELDFNASKPIYIIGSVTENLNTEWLNTTESKFGESCKLEVVEITHPDPTVYQKFFYNFNSDDEYYASKNWNEEIYNRYRAVIIKVESGNPGSNAFNISGYIPRNFLLLYHRSIYPDVRVFKKRSKHIITWDKYDEERQIFINSFDSKLKSTPPENKLLGALDNASASFTFQFQLENLGANSMRVKSEIYLYGNNAVLDKLSSTLDLKPGGSGEVILEVGNKKRMLKNYRIQLFILNKSQEDGKLSLSDFSIINNYIQVVDSVSQ